MDRLQGEAGQARLASKTSVLTGPETILLAGNEFREEVL
jgi:hypothetical protein